MFQNTLRRILFCQYLLDEEIMKRFWKFLISENHTAAGLSKCIMEQLDIILESNKQKLMFQMLNRGKKGSSKN